MTHENTLYGLREPLDEELLSRGQEVLAAAARRRAVLTYTEFSDDVPGVGRRGRKMAAVLAVLGRRSYAELDAIITVLVVNKASGLPSEGFYILQRDLRPGLTGTEETLARHERERVYAAYPLV